MCVFRSVMDIRRRGLRSGRHFPFYTLPTIFTRNLFDLGFSLYFGSRAQLLWAFVDAIDYALSPSFPSRLSPSLSPCTHPALGRLFVLYITSYIAHSPDPECRRCFWKPSTRASCRIRSSSLRSHGSQIHGTPLRAIHSTKGASRAAHVHADGRGPPAVALAQPPPARWQLRARMSGGGGRETRIGARSGTGVNTGAGTERLWCGARAVLRGEERAEACVHLGDGGDVVPGLLRVRCG